MKGLIKKNDTVKVRNTTYYLAEWVDKKGRIVDRTIEETKVYKARFFSTVPKKQCEMVRDFLRG